MTTIVNTYHVGYPDIDDLGASFLAVLVRKPNGQFKAFTGIVKLPETASPDYAGARDEAAHRVAALGRPEQFEGAKKFYPALSAADYE